MAAVRRLLAVPPVLALMLLCGLPAPSLAVTPQALIAAQKAAAGPPSAQAAPPPPGDLLTPEQVDGHVAALTDEQARAQLLERLHAEAEQRRQAEIAAAAPQRTGLDAAAEMMAARIERTKARAAEARNEAANIRDHGEIMLMALTDQQGWPAVGRGAGILAALLILGGLLEWGLRRALSATRHRLGAALGSTPLSRVGTFASLLMFDALALAVFTVGAAVLSFAFYPKHDPMREVLITIILAISLVRGVHLLALRVISGPGSLIPVSAEFGQRLMTWIVGLSALVSFTIAVPPMMRHLGLPEVLSRAFVQPFIALILIATIAMVWRLRAHFVREQGAETQLPATYFIFATAYGAIVYLVTAETSFLGEKSTAIYAYLSFILVIVAPSLVGLLNRTLDHVAPPAASVLPPDETGTVSETALAAAAGGSLQVRTKTLLLGFAYFVILSFAFALLMETWFRGTLGIAQTEAGARVGRAIINIYITALLAYIAWQRVEGWAQKHLADDEAERQGAADGEDSETSVPKRSRMGTLAPLIRFTVIIALAATVIMIVLSSVGIDIAPLLAGAGVVGIAVGFGAQSLVRDILSGVFFLIDDRSGPCSCAITGARCSPYPMAPCAPSSITIAISPSISRNSASPTTPTSKR